MPICWSAFVYAEILPEEMKMGMNSTKQNEGSDRVELLVLADVQWSGMELVIIHQKFIYREILVVVSFK